MVYGYNVLLQHFHFKEMLIFYGAVPSALNANESIQLLPFIHSLEFTINLKGHKIVENHRSCFQPTQ